jgi:ATP-dependent Clp protease ATP-binding subunit ClpC
MDDVMTDDLRAVLDQAAREAFALNHRYIGTEHLLLALAQVTDDLGANTGAAIGRVHEIVGPGQQPVDVPELPCTPRSKRTLLAANRAAKDDGSAAVGTRHLLQALANEPDGVAGRVLAELGAA